MADSTTVIAVPASVGPPGPRGYSAFEVWTREGNTGTFEDFLGALVGAKGDGGASAFELAQEAGFAGTQSEWLASLVGPQGPKGDKGDKGDTGTAGAKGDTGDTGPAGAQGIQGIQGPKGDKGDKGDTGPQGANGAATMVVGTVTTGAAGSAASVTNSGTASVAVLDFVLPAGADGAQGPKGDTGDTGPQGLKGDQGDQGDQGPQGIQGPKGDTGDTGPAGAQGIQGPKGDTGDTGPQGIQGVKGDTGDTGPQGPAGAAATVTVGTVTTGAAGSSATVTNGGTSSAAVLNFVIPRGADGEGGGSGGGFSVDDIKGDWDSGTTYTEGNIVQHENAVFVKTDLTDDHSEPLGAKAKNLQAQSALATEAASDKVTFITFTVPSSKTVNVFTARVNSATAARAILVEFTSGEVTEAVSIAGTTNTVLFDGVGTVGTTASFTLPSPVTLVSGTTYGLYLVTDTAVVYSASGATQTGLTLTDFRSAPDVDTDFTATVTGAPGFALYSLGTPQWAELAPAGLPDATDLADGMTVVVEDGVWTVGVAASGGGGGGGSEATLDYTPSPLAVAGGVSADVNLGKTYVLKAIESDFLVRIRMYISAAYRDADIDRDSVTDPLAQSGLIADLQADNIEGAFRLSPAIVGAPLTSSTYIRVDNLEDEIVTPTVTFTYTTLEA